MTCWRRLEDRLVVEVGRPGSRCTSFVGFERNASSDFQRLSVVVVVVVVVVDVVVVVVVDVNVNVLRHLTNVLKPNSFRSLTSDCEEAAMMEM